jgi:hypothetical protein
MLLHLEMKQNISQGWMWRHAQTSDKEIFIHHGLVIVWLRHGFVPGCTSLVLHKVTLLLHFLILLIVMVNDPK